jgi:hypothetical protein
VILLRRRQQAAAGWNNDVVGVPVEPDVLAGYRPGRRLERILHVIMQAVARLGVVNNDAFAIR